MNGRTEERFWNTLQNLFVGVPVEGESGYINLMRLKTQYFQHAMRPALQQFIADQLREFPDFREELFDKLYTFLKRYISEETGSLGFFFTPYHQSVYEHVYTDAQDVVLFWKTQRLYYVKTDRLFRSMETEVDGFKFFFDASTLKHKKANEKRELVFEFKQIRQSDGALVFAMTYSEHGRQNDLVEIRRQIRDALGLARYTDAVPSEATLEQAFRVFERQSEVDYFLCKDAKSFLREQFDLWLWQYLLGKPGEEPNTEWTEARLKQLQALKRVAYRVIDYIAAFEDELVKIWEKPKFVLNSHYVITLDRIVAQAGGWAVLDRILAHPNFGQQLQEWRELGMVDDSFTPAQLFEQNSMADRQLSPRYQRLPIDTRHFEDLELEILALFDNLDESLDGWLIKSENYQALKTILPKWRGKVQCIYIDPPYNTGYDEFVYADRFKSASWLTMMANRLQVGRDILSEQGLIAVSIDENQMPSLRIVMEEIFGDNCYKNEIVVKRGAKSVQAQFDTLDSLNKGHEYVLLFAKSADKRLPKVYVGEARPVGSWNNHWRGTNRPTMRYELFGIIPKTGQWRWSEERSRRAIQNYQQMLQEMGGDESKITQQDIDNWVAKQSAKTGEVVDLLRLSKTRKPEHYVPPSKGTLLSDLWSDIQASNSSKLSELFARIEFPNPKSVELVERLAKVCGSNEALFLDFFAGSGTTAHAVMNLNRQDGGRRRFILVEMADYFYSVLLPRVKKVAFSDKWRSGKAQPEGEGVGCFVKYYELEQFEDTLRRTRYADDEPIASSDPPCYLFLRDAKLSDALQIEGDSVQVWPKQLYPNIDLAETLSNLLGKPIRQIVPDPDDPTRPAKVIFADGSEADLQNPDWKLIKPLIWW